MGEEKAKKENLAPKKIFFFFFFFFPPNSADLVERPLITLDPLVRGCGRVNWCTGCQAVRIVQGDHVGSSGVGPMASFQSTMDLDSAVV